MTFDNLKSPNRQQRPGVSILDLAESCVKWAARRSCPAGCRLGTSLGW